MSSEGPPEPWRSFFDELDSRLSHPVELHCLGGFALIHVYGVSRTTNDCDFVAWIPNDSQPLLSQLGGEGSELHRRYNVYLDPVTVVNYPDTYDSRLIPIFEGRWKLLKLLVRAGKVADAISYFHRAIYGHWNQNAPASRLSARFELIDLLAKRGTKEELLAELLPVEDEAPQDTETRMRRGRLFLEAGSTMRAAAIFRSILHDHPGQADALAGLGEAEFASGDYSGARNDFAAALRINPTDREASARLEICEQVLALDPARRGLNSEQRFERSRTILQLVVNEASRCVASHPSTEVQDLLERARSVLSRRTTASQRDDVFESNAYSDASGAMTECVGNAPYRRARFVLARERRYRDASGCCDQPSASFRRTCCPAM